MKKRHLIIILCPLLLASCRSELDDITLNDNPYDKDYAGPKVVHIDSVATKVVGLTKYNHVYLRVSTDLYDKVNLYANGVKVKTISRAAFGPDVTEEIIHSPVYTGNYFSYQVQLGQNDGVTSLSDPKDFTTQ